MKKFKFGDKVKDDWWKDRKYIFIAYKKYKSERFKKLNLVLVIESASYNLNYISFETVPESRLKRGWKTEKDN